MSEELQSFILYLREKKKTTENTIISYERDLKKMNQYFTEQGIQSSSQITVVNLNSYILYLEKLGRKPSTISRSIASIKAFFYFLCREHLLEENPAEDLKAPRIEKKEPSTLTREEAARLLDGAKGTSPKELRDSAMLELLYATGIRVSQLISLKLQDVNLNMEYVICRNGKKELTAPFGKAAKRAMELYLAQGRPVLVTDTNSTYLFPNCSGQGMSRQGFWKLIKHYGRKAGISTELTPHTLRCSFMVHLIK